MDPTSLAYALVIWSITAFGLILFLLQIAAKEVGLWLGMRHHKEPPAEGVGVVVGSMLALLAFVLALTLSFANSRFNERLDGTLSEANAIGTAWLRAQAVGGPGGEQVSRLLEGYAGVRTEFVQAPPVLTTIDAISQRSDQLQSQIWAEVTKVVRERPDPISESLMSSLNQAFDAASAVRFAFEKRLPGALLWLLIGSTLLSMGTLGYQLGLRGKPLRILSMLLAAMWSLVIVDIIDLAATRLGTFRTSDLAYRWTIQSFAPAASLATPSRPQGR
jgi:hypothetical protein